MENPLRITPVPSPSASSQLRRSSTSWKLTNMAMLLAEEEEPASRHAPPLMKRPPRHSSAPTCAQTLLKLWQHELQRMDVSMTSDFFYDLEGTDEQAFYLVESMQRHGFHISVTQFFELPRCSIYSVLLLVLTR
jgi:hypothetical protein|uniref:Carrier domain-containing protein n=1 Tax=Globisporangium ultimum (strain ATCC 200006 / CBS 805.95 / DAOM BR144) TaxID=431595 RepID=K3X7L3_GLOUD